MRLLCRLDDIADGGAMGFEFGEGLSRLDIVIVRKGEQIHAYLNSCPHQGTPLEIFPDRFLTGDSGRLLCSTHGAQFRIEDGLCLQGPCEGEFLKYLPVEIRDGKIMIKSL